ncbi:iron-containing alcohol dehydrogenase [Oscillibacter sp.]|uniref:iron-containing alcohol dehydrogenase n=1 Tax=Oscillibacter sp. TaxID=1945593 RepID=UPI002638F199|nr:iron-containing alcohol dehydrogenase [Oscillibacter sp.]MDD3347651.1 iron-containing alcohol dehydrogenase [Oscillibacter sp.]
MPSGKAKESRAFQSPSRYIQGPGELKNLPIFAGHYGKTALAIIDTFFYPEYQAKIPQLFAEAGMTAYTVEYSGAASDLALEKLLAFCKTLPQIPDTFIGIGGGQTCDINKAVGATFQKAFINVPTALTTDAPTSTHTIINNPHEQPRLMVHSKNPDYVVVDTEITVQSPAWMMVSGIGDALATYIESEASFANNNVCNAGAGEYRPALLGMAAAKLCYEILLEKGRAAIRAARNHLRTPAYEDVVEATVLLSGLGFECTGVSIAHGLQAGFHVLPIKPLLHGTGVGYCTLIQLIVENDTDRFAEIFEFCKDIGLPVCTADLGLTDENRDASIEALVDEVYGKRWNVSNVPHYFCRATLADAIRYLDVYASERA